jgi:hypothetical protein
VRSAGAEGARSSRHPSAREVLADPAKQGVSARDIGALRQRGSVLCPFELWRHRFGLGENVSERDLAVFYREQALP